MKTTELLVLAEQVEKALRDAGIDLCDEKMSPATDAEVDAVEARLDWKVHEDIVAFWKRGFDGCSATVLEDPYVAIGFDFLDASLVLRDLPGDRNLYAAEWEKNENTKALKGRERDFVELLRDGVGLTYSNPRLLADRKGAIWLVNTSDCVAHRVADRFADFLRDWIGAGLIGRADTLDGAKTWLERARPAIPKELQTTASANPWLSAYGGYFWT